MIPTKFEDFQRVLLSRSDAWTKEGYAPTYLTINQLTQLTMILAEHIWEQDSQIEELKQRIELMDSNR